MSALPHQRARDGGLLRELAHESCGFVILYAEAAQRFCEAGDDVGLRYSMRSLVAYVRAAAQTCEQLSAEPRSTAFREAAE
jgi:hypothetical protein